MTDELRALRDWAEYVAATAQHALGFYGSGGDVPAEQIVSCKARCEAILSEHPTLRAALARMTVTS